MKTIVIKEKESKKVVRRILVDYDDTEINYFAKLILFDFCEINSLNYNLYEIEII